MSCRIIIVYSNPLFGHGLRSLLTRDAEFEVPVAMPEDGDLAAAVRAHRPDGIIVEGKGLPPCNSQALLEAALGEPRVRVVNVRIDATPLILWRPVAVVPQGQESVAEALKRALTGPADA